MAVDPLLNPWEDEPAESEPADVDPWAPEWAEDPTTGAPLTADGTVGCLENAIGLLAVVAAGAAVGGYVWVLRALGAQFGPANFVGGALVTVSAAVNVAYWGYRWAGSTALAADYERGLKYLLAPFNVAFGLYAAVVLAVALQAGRNPAGGFVLTLWSIGPAFFGLTRLARRLADRILPPETRTEFHEPVPDDG
ncbi:hypothetical protein [Alienimonas sp. DA493]|uniref:hypothetical protein n=1 Tax=Alienimonas sp. DA493 TaxID=3373605 RepID=UPI003754E02B